MPTLCLGISRQGCGSERRSVGPESHGWVITAQRMLRGGVPVAPISQKGRLRHRKAAELVSGGAGVPARPPASSHPDARDADALTSGRTRQLSAHRMRSEWARASPSPDDEDPPQVTHLSWGLWLDPTAVAGELRERGSRPGWRGPCKGPPDPLGCWPLPVRGPPSPKPSGSPSSPPCRLQLCGRVF